MKKIVLILFVLLITAAMTASAEGDKKRGEKGTGEVWQEQVRNTEEGTPAF
jgi:hypothetical protein